MISKYKFWFWESVLSKNECQKIIEEHFLQKQLVDATYVNKDGVDTLDSDIRKTEVSWVAPDTDLGAVLFRYFVEANLNAGWNFDFTGIEHLQIGRYTDKGHYDWHRDIDVPDAQGYQRKLSVSLLLSDPQDYEGGILEFGENKEAFESATSKQGSIIVFPSYIQHRVTPVTAGERFSAVTWMRGKAFR